MRAARPSPFSPPPRQTPGRYSTSLSTPRPLDSQPPSTRQLSPRGASNPSPTPTQTTPTASSTIRSTVIQSAPTTSVGRISDPSQRSKAPQPPHFLTLKNLRSYG